jgi:uncharacterized OsmC-like protein
MTADAQIREAQERAMAVFRRRPETALSSVAAEATVGSGLTCTFVQGAHSAVMDMPATVGGSDEGPTPGFFARAAIAGCVAIGIKMTAARLGIEVKSVRVGLEMDFDNSAMFGMGSASAAPLVTRLDVALESDAAAEALEDLVETALRADPYFLALRDPQHVETRITVV